MPTRSGATDQKRAKKLWDGSEPTSTVAGQQPAYATETPDKSSSQGSPIARSQSGLSVGDGAETGNPDIRFSRSPAAAIHAATITDLKAPIGDVVFSQGSAVAPGQDITLEQAHNVINKVLDGLGMRSVVTAVAFRNPAEAGIATPPDVVPSGGTRRGEVFIFTDNIADEAEAFRVVFHELFHLGLSQSVQQSAYVQTMLGFLQDPLVRQYVSA